MAQTAGGTYYAASSELVSSWPATSLDLANQLESRFAAKAALSGATYTGTHNFSSATVTGIPGGLTIIAPSSIANAGGSASASGGAVTFTTVTSLSVNGVFSSTYDAYLVVVGLTSSTGTGNLFMRMRASGSDNTNNEYTRSKFYWTSSNTTGTDTGSSGTSSFLIGEPGGSNNAVSFINLWAPFLTQRTKHNTQAAKDTNGLLYSGSTTVTTSYDGFTILHDVTNITGTVRVYGMKNS